MIYVVHQMNDNRARRNKTEAQLRLALKRVELGRGKIVSSTRPISIVSVAQEAGINPSTVHTRYPQIADLIRKKSKERNRSNGQRDNNASLRNELRTTKARVQELRLLLANVTSNYQSCLLELERLRTIAASAGKATTLSRTDQHD